MLRKSSTVRLLIVASVAAVTLAAFVSSSVAAEDRVVNFETGEPGSADHEDFSFWVRGDSDREIVYAYGKDRKEVTLKPLGVTGAGRDARLRLGFPNGHVLTLTIDGEALRVSDEAGRYAKTFRWEYEGPVDGRGTFCTPCVEEQDAMAFLKTHYFK